MEQPEFVQFFSEFAYDFVKAIAVGNEFILLKRKKKRTKFA